MLSQSQLDRILLYIYMGQLTGEWGLLKTDLQLNVDARALQYSTAVSDLVKMKLIEERDCSLIMKSIYPSPIFLKTTKQGEKKGRAIIKQMIANAADLPRRLESIHNRMLLFLVKYELLKLNGRYPVDLRNAPFSYVKDSLDIQRDMFNCLLLPLENPRLNIKLLDEREKLFNTLVAMSFCVTASAYRIEGERKFKMHSFGRLNYCVPHDVLNFLYDQFKSEIDSFEFSKELQQGHIYYHLFKEMSKSYYDGTYYNGTGSWLKRASYDEIELIDDSRVSDILNDMRTRKLILPSNKTIQHEEKTWRLYRASSWEDERECIRYLEHRFLEPIFRFLSAEIELADKKGERESPEEQMDIIIDGSNVAYDNVPKGQQPRYQNIILALDYYRRKNLRAKVIVDASLRHKIDQKEAFQEALDNKLISQAPSRVEADEYILRLALSHKDSKIVSNDDFKDWIEKTSLSGDLRIVKEVFSRRERFVKFKINGEFIEF